MTNNSRVKIETAFASSNEDDGVDPSDSVWECAGGGQVPQNNHDSVEFGNVLLKKQKKRIHPPTEVQVETKSYKRLRKSKKKCAVIVMADEDEDKCHSVVTVEVETRSECPGQDGAILSKHVKVNLLSHCIFCLRKITKCSIGKHQSSSHLLSTFNCTWSYLQRKIKIGAEGDDPLSFLEFITLRESKEKDKMTFLDLPSMCEPCAEKLETFDRLFSELQTQLNIIETIIPASKCSEKNSRRSEYFTSLLKASSLEEEVVAATTMVLEKLGGGSKVPCESEPLATTGLTPNSGTLTAKGHNKSLVMPEDAKQQGKTLLPEPSRESENDNTLDSSNVHRYESLIPHSEEERAHDNFVEEDDWNDDNDHDPDYIKSEPDDNFSEDEAPSSDDMSTSKTSTTRRENVDIPSSSTVFHGKNTTSEQIVGTISSSSNKAKADVQVKVPNLLNETHQCNQCDKSFSESSQLEHHKLKVHGLAAAILHSCDLCKAQVPLRDIFEHVRAHVGDEYLIKCPNSQCPRAYTRVSSVRNHLRTARNCCTKEQYLDTMDTFVICKICGHRAKSVRTLQTHLLREHENPSKDFSCPIDGCLQKFSARQSVALHIARHDVPPKLLARLPRKHENPSKDFACPIVGCPPQYSAKQSVALDIDNHDSAKISIVQQCVCDLCNAKVSSDDILEHVRAHIGDEYIIKCPNSKCARIFSQLYSLKFHLKESTAGSHCRKSLSNVQEFFDTFNICQVCGHKAADINSLRHHLLREHENETKSFACPIDGCSKKFSSRQSVAFHISHHDISKDFKRQKCSECGKFFKPSEMADHFAEAHQREIIKCTRCLAVFASRESLVNHMFSHRHGVLFCDICDNEKFSNHAKLREHYFFKHQVGTRYTCEQCGFVTLSNKQLGRHKRHKKHGKTHDIGGDASVDGSATLQCNICLLSFSHRISLQDHNIKEHGAPPLRCTFCNQAFLTHALHRKHELQHNGGPEPRFTCDIEGCGRKFRQKKGLQHHVESHHSGEKHVCEICAKAFSHAAYLKTHQEIVHFRLAKCICETCGESFSCRQVLRTHKLIHTGQRDYACEICGQMFRHKEVLNRHVQAHRRKGADFKPNGPMKQIRKRVKRKN